MNRPILPTTAAEIARAIGFIGLALTAALTLGTNVNAATVPIISYDIAQTPRSGFGCWFHDYNGTITNTGRTVTVQPVCSADGSEIANYSGGSGTLNDGVISGPFTLNGVHLFTTMDADDGQPISPVITLHLGGTVVIKSIQLFGGDFCCNTIPGALDGVTVEIGATSVALTTVPFGTPDVIGVQPNDLLDLSNTALAGVPTDQIVLRNFTASLSGVPFNYFSITEIVVVPTNQAPEPGTLALFGLGLAGLGFARWQRKQ